MATKFGLAGGIPERRVRPIWDAVDSRQFKAALKLCTGLLAKYPNSPYALALKALISERMGKPDEALSICLSAREQLFSNDIVHIDDLTLSTLQMVLQRLNRLDLATSCYEHACGKYPNNLELMMGLFNCYVREYAYVKQQQTAIKMYKVVGEERFLLWAVCSIQLQVFCTGAGEKLLPLAEALLRKHVTAHSLHEPEALLVYIAVLEQQAKYGAALEVLSGNLGSLLSVEADKLRMQGRLLARAGDYNAAIGVFQHILELCPDDWESFLHYLGCLLEEDMSWPKEIFSGQLCSRGCKSCKPCRLAENLFEERMSSALSFIEKLQLKVNGDPVRCPYLAKIEIEKCLRLHGKSTKEKLQEALLEYFTRFSHLACFASDIEVFLDVLTHEEKVELLEMFMEVTKSLSSTPVQAMGRAVTIFRIKELFVTKFGLFISELRDTSLKMVDLYCKNLSFSKDLDPQENMHGEELLSMACNVLVQLFWRTRHPSYLLEAILILEFGLTIRGHVWQYKILLLHLYSYLGALPLAYEWYGTLEIKNILLETVSHHILPQMLKSPLWSDLADIMREYLKFMDDYMREAADLTFVAYRHRNYSKAIEFVLFKERLQNSCQYLMAKVETSILQLKQNADSLEEVEHTLENLNFGIDFVQLSNDERYKSFTFNEDLHSRPWWSPTPDINYLFEHFSGMDYSDEKLCERQAIVSKAIKRRSLLPRMVYLSTQIAPLSFKENIDANGSVHDKKSFLEFKSLLEQYSADLGYPFEETIKVIPGILDDQKSFKDFGSDVLCWMNFAVFFNAWNLCSHHYGETAGERFSHSTWNLVDRLIQKCIKEQLVSSPLPLMCPGSNIPVLVQLVTESCSWHILIIQSYLRSMLPSSKKKKKSGPADQLSTSHSHVIRSSIELLSSAIEEVKNWLDHQLTKSPDESVDVLLSLLQEAKFGEDPGDVFHMVEDFASVGNPEIGEKFSLALQSWSSADVLRKFVKAQHTMLLKFHLMCESKLRLLDSLKVSVQHV